MLICGALIVMPLVVISMLQPPTLRVIFWAASRLSLPAPTFTVRFPLSTFRSSLPCEIVTARLPVSTVRVSSL